VNSFHRILPYAICFLACTAVDLFYFSNGLIFSDEKRYFESAIRLATTGEFWVGNDRAWEMPGTAVLYSIPMWLFGPETAIRTIRFIQSILVVVQCAIVASIAGRIVQKNVATLVAAYITAIYPFFLFYQGLLLSETLFDTLLIASLASLYIWLEKGGRIDASFTMTCVLFVGATLTKATLTMFPPFVMAASAWLAGKTARRSVAVLAAAFVLYSLLLLPWWVRNYEILGAFVPFTTSAAQNLYLGNNALNQDGGADWATDVDVDTVHRLREMPGEIERQREFSRLATSYMMEHPLTVTRVAIKKLARFWSPIPNTEQYRGIYAIVSAATFGTVFGLALVGIFRLRRQWRLLVPILAVIGYFSLLHAVVIASIRYRLPLEPLLIVLAAEPIASILEGSVARRPTRKAADRKSAGRTDNSHAPWGPGLQSLYGRCAAAERSHAQLRIVDAQD
jgi:4-amino-4-deoxy-L-arabinose transferase-like glycosyltransferase